jgi:large subunit ribosomal protein L15
MPLVRRIPKRGFKNRFRVECQVVNLRDLDRVCSDGETVSPDVMIERGVIRRDSRPVKVLGSGDLSKKLTVQAHRFSASARTAIEKAGGSCEVVEP